MEIEQNPFTKLKQRGLGHFLRGICMGTADVIPGVSGATIAMITGIYDELIATVAGVNTSILRSVAGGRFLEALARLNAGFLVPLLAGVAVAFLSLAKLITYLLVTHPKPLWGFFTGLVLAGALFVARHIKAWDLVLGLALVLGVGIGYGVTVLVPMETGTETYKFVLAGMIAIVAMILPGISGSFLLVIMGKYQQVFTAIHERELTIIAAFGAGCVVGILAFSRVLKRLLASYHDLTLAFLVGLMLGSLRKTWPFQRILETTVLGSGKEVPVRFECILPEAYDGTAMLSLALIAAGFVAVYLLERLGNKNA
jgi:putative membrane protein